MTHEFAQYMADVFRSFGPVSLRRMFSGFGVFHDGLMFGLIFDDVLYLKADAQTCEDFRRLGLGQFEYPRQGKIVGLSYYQAPDGVMEDPDLAAQWARRAFDAALRSHRAKPKTERSRKKR